MIFLATDWTDDTDSFSFRIGAAAIVWRAGRPPHYSILLGAYHEVWWRGRLARDMIGRMEFREYRRRLPHLRQSNATYFITWRLSDGAMLLSEKERDAVIETFRHFHQERYELYGCVVMDDHAHAVCRPYEGFELESIVQTWKSYTSKVIQGMRGRTGVLWQDEYFDRIVRDEAELLAKLGYMKNNPFKHWPELESYRWLWLGEGSE